MTLINADHTHQPNFRVEPLLEKRRKQKDCATVSNEPPRKIIAKFANELKDPEIIANQPTYSADRQAINRAKNKMRPDYPKDPEKLSDINLPEFLKHALSR